MDQRGVVSQLARASDCRLSAIDLHVAGRVPGTDAAAFAEAAATARLRALRSGGAREDLPGELRAKLEPST